MVRHVRHKYMVSWTKGTADHPTVPSPLVSHHYQSSEVLNYIYLMCNIINNSDSLFLQTIPLIPTVTTWQHKHDFSSIQNLNIY